MYGQNFDFKIRRDTQKNSYEQRIYESVNDSSLSYAVNLKPTRNKELQQKVNLSILKNPTSLIIKITDCEFMKIQPCANK